MRDSVPYSAFRELVPLRYWRRTGLDAYTFKIHQPWPFVCRHRLANGAVTEVTPSLLYSHRYGDDYRHFLLPFRSYSVLCEALLLLSRLTTGGRLHRYLTLYKAYELITETPDPRYAALRHSIAHAGSLLSGTRTLEALDAALGTRFLNLQRGRDKRVFFCAFAEMLQVTDWRLARLLHHAGRRIELSSRSEVELAMVGAAR